MWYDPAAAKADRGGPPRERGLNDVGRIAAPPGAAFTAESGTRVQGFLRVRWTVYRGRGSGGLNTGRPEARADLYPKRSPVDFEGCSASSPTTKHSLF